MLSRPCGAFNLHQLDLTESVRCQLETALSELKLGKPHATTFFPVPGLERNKVDEQPNLPTQCSKSTYLLAGEVPCPK